MYKIEFEDQGQDLLRLTCDEETGEILSAEPFHHNRYADGRHFVNVSMLQSHRMVSYQNPDDETVFFKWPMARLFLNGELLASTDQGAARTTLRLTKAQITARIDQPGPVPITEENDQYLSEARDLANISDQRGAFEQKLHTYLTLILVELDLGNFEVIND